MSTMPYKLWCAARRHAALLLALTLAPRLAHGAPDGGGCDAGRIGALPLIERPGSDSSGVVVILMTGDGGWANADEQVARGLVARGAAVVGLNMRAYLRDGRSPDEVAHDVSCLATAYMSRWHRTHFMLLGYSRGADIAPFVAARLSGALRDRLTRLALVSPTVWASFQFHFIDLVRDVHRAEDLPVLPELQRLQGVAITCIYGTQDEDSACPGLDTRLGGEVRVIARDGGHRITGGFDVMADALTEGLHPATSAAR